MPDNDERKPPTNGVSVKKMIVSMLMSMLKKIKIGQVWQKNFSTKETEIEYVLQKKNAW